MVSRDAPAAPEQPDRVVQHDHGEGEHGHRSHDHGAGELGPKRHDHGAGEHGHRSHDHGGHDHGGGLLARLRDLIVPHSHDLADQVDTELETSALGVRALWVSLAGLGITAAIQAAVVLLSGSVALLGDTLHNLADALTALPLFLAFTLGRRASTRRYTYGYGRAEDLAGVVVVLAITASSALAAYEAATRLAHPRDVHYLGAVAGASIIGFLGNEIVAAYRIRIGRRIGSAALVADGLHARTDGLTSLAVLVGAGGVALGWRWADPAVGLAITAAILVVLRQAAREVYRRLMDAVDPALLDAAERTLRGVDGVRALGEVRLRWIGHALRAEAEVVVDPELSLVSAHRVAEEAQHALLHGLPRLTSVLVHADPDSVDGRDHHDVSRHHRPADRPSD